MKLYTILLLGTIIWLMNLIKTADTLNIVMTTIFIIALFAYSHYKDVMSE